MDTPQAQSALHETFRLQGARWEKRGCWQVPAAFGSVDAELAAASTAVAIGERWDAGVLELEGEDLQDLAVRLGVGDVPIGTAAPFSLDGLGEARWCRLTRSRARILVDGEDRNRAQPALEFGGTCLHRVDLSSGLTTLAVLGPRSPDLLARIVRIDVDPRVFVDRTLTLTEAVGIPLQLLRWDCGTRLAYELTVGRDVAAYLWENLSHAGEDLGLRSIGVEALSTLQPSVSGSR
jgi:glycine cleavage system aminomethyltransferase T